MKTVPAAVLAALLLTANAVAAPRELATEEDRLNYSIGWSVGSQMGQDKIPLRPEPLLQGVTDAIAGTGRLLTDDQMRELFRALQRKNSLRKEEEAKARSEKAVVEGKAFLEANAKKEGVKTLPSGLQIKMLKVGDGPSPKATDTVSVHYKGTLLDGTVFDSSYSRGKQATFRLDQVIDGWTEGLQLMKVNGKAILYVPSELGYGTKGAGDQIPGNSTLIFEVELFSVNPPR